SDSEAVKVMDLESWYAVIGLEKFPVMAEAARVLFSIPTSQAAMEKASSLVIMYANAKLHQKEVSLVDVMRGYIEDNDPDASGEEEEDEGDDAIGSDSEDDDDN
ncbi:hypothetical protein HDU80_010199, partial [Chytriomyces hyalinus]